jgi:hypothetical protein
LNDRAEVRFSAPPEVEWATTVNPSHHKRVTEVKDIDGKRYRRVEEERMAGLGLDCGERGGEAENGSVVAPLPHPIECWRICKGVANGNATPKIDVDLQ